MKKLKDLPKVDILVFACLLIAGLRLTWGLENRLDIGLYDESLYLYHGVELFKLGVPPAEGAPLYALWYFLLSLIQPNRISLYYLSYKLSIILLPLFAYAVMRSKRASVVVSLLAAWVLLVSRENTLAWPRVSHYALFLILVTLWLIKRERTLLWNGLIASAGALLVAYIRPEYFLAYGLFILLCAFLLARSPQKAGKKKVPGLVLVGLFSLAVLSILGIPETQERSFLAFGQHFAVNWVSWKRSAIDPFTNWGEIITGNFGPVQSIAGALVGNPLLFLKHVATNLLHFVINAPQIFLPENITLRTFTSILLIVLVLSALIVYFVNVSYKDTVARHLEAVRNKLREQNAFVILAGIFLLPPLLSIALIYPRDHYLLLVLVPLVVLTGALFSAQHLEQTIAVTKPLALLCIALLVVTPKIGGEIAVVQRPNLDTIWAIQSLNIEDPVNVLEAEGGYYIYLGDNFLRVAEYEKDTGFGNFREGQHIEMVVLSNALLNDARFQNDPEWQAFLEDFRRWGYMEIAIPDTDRMIIVKRSLLNGQ